MIGVVAALRTEVRAVSHPRLSVTAGGVGFERAQAAAERMVREVAPELLVATGFCGAVDPSLATGDLVAGGTVREGRRFPPEERAVSAVPGARRADTLWVPAVRRNLGAVEGAAAVDMESAAVAEVAAAHALPFLMLRAVLDTPDAPLASDYRWTTILKPWTWFGIPRDARRARAAASSLKKGLYALAERY